MIKPFSSILNRKKDESLISSGKITYKKVSEKSKPLIIIGFIISISSILLLLFTIQKEFG